MLIDGIEASELTEVQVALRLAASLGKLASGTIGEAVQ